MSTGKENMNTTPQRVETELPPYPTKNQIGRDPSDPSRVRINADLQYNQTDYTNKNRPHTRGEKYFNIGVHVVLDFIINGILSVAFTHFISTSERFNAKSKYESFKGWMVDKAGKARSKLGMKENKDATEEFGHYFADLFTLSMVGHVLLFPIKALKDREAKIVRWIDKKLDGSRELSDQEKAYREMAYAAIEQKPKQTPLRVILSRIGALALNWGVLTGVVDKMILKNKTIEFKHKNLKGYTDIVADVATKKFLPNLGKKNKETVESITKLSMYELLSVSLTALGLKKVMTFIEKFVGKREKKRNEENSPPATQAPINTRASSSPDTTNTPQQEKSEDKATPAKKSHADKVLQNATGEAEIALSY